MDDNIVLTFSGIIWLDNNIIVVIGLDYNIVFNIWR
jgi:hypothetical protein